MMPAFVKGCPNPKYLLMNFIFIFYNLGCPSQLARTSINLTESMHYTLGSFPIRIRINRWLFIRRCDLKELFTFYGK